MAIYRLQGKAEKRSGIYYEFDPSEEPLGEGGMGKVYKGRCVNEVTGTAFDVAIKFMFSDLPAHAIERARREASIQIRHDNLVEMLGFIDIEEKGPLGDIQHHYHVVSELLDGIMLDDLLAGKLTNKRGEPMPFAQKLYNDYQRDPYHFATYIIRNVLSGLMALHDAGYIHRDIDPTNIMITSNGHIKLIDFGIAKQMQSLTTNDKSLTVAGVFMGKPEYAAPELILGDIKSQDKTTDIYAVGILLFQCIIGHPPFEGDRHEVMNKQLHQKMPLGLIKNKQIRKIIETATDKTRAKRFRSAAEFRVALDQIALNGTGGGFEWKPLYTYIISGVAACGIIVGGAVLAITSLSGEKEQDIEEKPYVFVPDEVKAIGYYAFSGYTAMESVTIPTSVSSIGYEAFYGCTGLKSVTIPNSVNVIEAGAFSGCTGLTSINIPNSIKEICPYAFEECTSLTSIEIPNGVEKIDEWAFCRCTGLISIFIPNSVTYIAPTAFDGCTNLENIYGNTPPFMDSFMRTPFFARSENWVHNNRCRYCGNKFKGSRNPKCSSCGHYKDY